MRKLSFVAAGLALALAACNANEKTETVKVNPTEVIDTTDHIGAKYIVDTTSTITWTGTKPTGQHTGTFKLKNGSLIADTTDLTGGSITIDMASLTNTDLAADPENKAKLESHLKEGDFFDVLKYPTSRFIISSVRPVTKEAEAQIKMKDATHIISGNLTLKDSTQNISFPARVKVAENKLTAVADISIDRTRWGINYKGAGNPQDWLISKTVNLKLNLNATKE